MKIDLYTRIVLTVIASCLVYLVVKDVGFIGHVQAQGRGLVDVNIVQIDGKPFVAYDVDSMKPALPVKISK